MKANELMIGDWVLTLDSTHKEKVLAQIDAIEEGQHSILVTRECSNWFVDIDWIEPISLTTEILEKNGWVYIAEDKVFYSEKLKGELPWIYYITDGSNEVFRMRDFCNLQYVHELQHALRLCGINHEIIL